MQTYRCNKELKQKQMEYDRLLHLKYTDLGQIQEIINYFLAKLEKAKSDNRCRMGTNDNRYKINEYHATINCLDRLYKERLNEHTQYPAINDIRNAVDGGKL